MSSPSRKISLSLFSINKDRSRALEPPERNLRIALEVDLQPLYEQLPANRRLRARGHARHRIREVLQRIRRRAAVQCVLTPEE